MKKITRKMERKKEEKKEEEVLELMRRLRGIYEVYARVRKRKEEDREVKKSRKGGVGKMMGRK